MQYFFSEASKLRRNDQGDYHRCHLADEKKKVLLIRQIFQNTHVSYPFSVEKERAHQ